MTSTPWQNQRAGRGCSRSLGGVAILDNETGLWFEQHVTTPTAEQSSSHQVVATEGMAAAELLLERLVTPRTLELPVERVLSLGFSRESILMPLNQLPSELGVEFLKYRHRRRVS